MASASPAIALAFNSCNLTLLKLGLPKSIPILFTLPANTVPNVKPIAPPSAVSTFNLCGSIGASSSPFCIIKEYAAASGTAIVPTAAPLDNLGAALNILPVILFA